MRTRKKNRRTLPAATPREISKLRALGRQLKALRIRKGVNQVQLAAASGIDQTHISAIERGRRNTNPSLLCVVKLAAALDVPPSVLCGSESR